MYIIYKNYACYCVNHFLIELGPSVDLFGSKISEGCCVVSNHFSVYSPTVMSKHHWSQYWLLEYLSPNFIIMLFKWHGSVFYGRSSLSQTLHFIPWNPYKMLSKFPNIFHHFTKYSLHFLIITEICSPSRTWVFFIGLLSSCSFSQDWHGNRPGAGGGVSARGLDIPSASHCGSQVITSLPSSGLCFLFEPRAIQFVAFYHPSCLASTGPEVCMVEALHKQGRSLWNNQYNSPD